LTDFIVSQKIKSVNSDREGRGKMEDKLTLSVEEAARLLGIGRNLCYDRVKTGEIPVIKIGRRLLVPRRALERFLEQGQVLSPPHRQE
jgi:excisionase family DNA binding protein